MLRLFNKNCVEDVTFIFDTKGRFTKVFDKILVLGKEHRYRTFTCYFAMPKPNLIIKMISYYDVVSFISLRLFEN